MADTFNRRFTDCLYCKTTVVTDCVLKYFWSRRTARLSMQIRPISNFYDYQPVSDVLINLAPSRILLLLRYNWHHVTCCFMYVVYMYQISFNFIDNFH